MEPTPPTAVRPATSAEGYVLGAAGVLVAWGLLAAGAAVGYALAAVMAGPLEMRLVPVRWKNLYGNGTVGVAGLFAMAGFLIETLRFQGAPRPGRYFRAWAAAPRLRVGLFAVLAAAAVGIGVFAGLVGDPT